MEKPIYTQPIVTSFSEEDIIAIEALARCSAGSATKCGGNCHKGSS